MPKCSASIWESKCDVRLGSFNSTAPIACNRGGILWLKSSTISRYCARLDPKDSARVKKRPARLCENPVPKMTALLSVRALTAFYGDYQALFGIDLDVQSGEVVGVIGANGAGKTTLLRTIAGVLPCARQAVRFRSEDIGG